jgi:hypothetical protein
MRTQRHFGLDFDLGSLAVLLVGICSVAALALSL